MISLSGILFFSAVLVSPLAVAQAPPTFSWDTLASTQNLTWVECYSTFQCTRLEGHYSDPSVGTAALAVIRLPTNVSKAEYRGPLLFNPGGPGESGVDTLVTVGQSAPLIFGNQYDFVSFDPRGVSYSTPIASFFETDAERAVWNAGEVPTSLNASSDSIPHDWARASLLGQLAAQRDASGILKYITTDNVARDMLRITESFGFEKLQYYGLSYGSVLGATFAALFPDKVGRILIDANLTIEATDTDKALQTFFDGCTAAGPDLCAFYAPTASAIEARLETLTAAVRARPVPVITSTGYGIVDYSLLRSVIYNSLYTPYALFPVLAQGLAALEAGNGTILFSMGETAPPFECDCTNATVPFHLNVAEATVAIQCGDAVEVNDSVEELRNFFENAARTSEFAEFFVGSNRVSCAGWKVYREDRFKGPVGAANTSFPLLLVANTADPVTPKAAALKTLAGFPGSALLTQDSPGHTSMTAPSLCTSAYFREYFVNGTLPPPGTVCPVNAALFGQPANSTSKRAEGEEEMLAALRIIADAVRPVITRKFTF
ncbi:TAP-like protein-domain-containing protein [Mycena rosella]|uniref:TAP-like protein-domain-containing protein n=1 Tax=Mycena rosella TaxID=1033263 RepID=A0AAD7G874_MYCRO|nr:TAP-like protein-domain-containing protein [Mycena rosella]